MSWRWGQKQPSMGCSPQELTLPSQCFGQPRSQWLYTREDGQDMAAGREGGHSARPTPATCGNTPHPQQQTFCCRDGQEPQCDSMRGGKIPRKCGAKRENSIWHPRPAGARATSSSDELQPTLSPLPPATKPSPREWSFKSTHLQQVLRSLLVNTKMPGAYKPPTARQAV